MNIPISEAYPWYTLEEVDSTQNTALRILRDNRSFGGVLARNQKAGRGRLGREWHSESDASLTATLIFREQANHPKPYLLGMALGVAAAGTMGCRVQWPNDLVLDGFKVGGILTEVQRDPDGQSVALVGIGLNLNQLRFPDEIAHRAASLRMITGQVYAPSAVVDAILAQLSALPEARNWPDLRPHWEPLDSTPGKRFLLPTGETAVAKAVGPSGELICTVGDAERTVLAADAIFGPQDPHLPAV